MQRAIARRGGSDVTFRMRRPYLGFRGGRVRRQEAVAQIKRREIRGKPYREERSPRISLRSIRATLPQRRRHPEVRAALRASKDGVQRFALRPSFEARPRGLAPQDDAAAGSANRRMGGAKRYPSHRARAQNDGFRFAQPILVIAKSIIVGVFRKEWPAAGCNLRQAAGDRIEPILSSLCCPVA